MRSSCEFNELVASVTDLQEDAHQSNLEMASTERWATTIEQNISSILAQLGENLSREGLRETPRRYEKAMQFLTSGYQVDLKQLVGNAVFKETADGIVIVRDIEVFSLCEHHLLPFFGKAHVAYLPAGRVIGLSKIPRIVDAFARRLQVQERLTQQIGEGLAELLQPKGVAVVIEAAHMCMMMRGVEKQRSMTTTSHMHGEFLSNASLRQEFLALLNRHSGGQIF
jgi:GTP cyclohydrolase IA